MIMEVFFMRCEAKTKKWFLLIGAFFLVAGKIVSAQSLQLDTRMTKKSYLEGEPIVFVLSLSNTGQKELTVAEPLPLEGFVKNIITTADGDEPNAPRLVWDILMPPQDYGVRLSPGETLQQTWSINESYCFGLKPGSYRLLSIYDTSKHENAYPGIWHGKLTVPELTFEVKVPVPMEENAYSLLKQGRDILLKAQRKRYNESRKALLDLVTQYPRSVYTPYAYYLLGKSYFVKQDDKTQHFAEAAEKFQDFLEKFPKYLYYSDIVRGSELPFCLVQTGRAALAQEILQKVPDGYYKQRMLRVIEKKGIGEQ
jgi:tetratricopeptide (TPR) repeat protein